MRFSEILSIGEAVLLEEPSTPAQTVLLLQRKTLKIGIDELTQKRDRFDAAIERLERELRRIDELAASDAVFRKRVSRLAPLPGESASGPKACAGQSAASAGEIIKDVARMLAYDSPAKVKDIEFGRMLELVQKWEPGA